MFTRIPSIYKHLLHCTLFILVILVFEVKSGGLKLWYTDADLGEFDPFVSYGYYFAWFLCLMRWLTLLSLPQFLFNFLGLILYNAFPEQSKAKTILPTQQNNLLPFICVRTVTRGDYPQLIHKNVLRNIDTCLEAGLENFIFEIVTDKPFEMPKDHRIRMIVVPSNYRTKTGTLYKVFGFFSKSGMLI